MKTLRQGYDETNQHIVNAQCVLANITDAGRECGPGQGAKVIRLRDLLAEAEGITRELLKATA